MNIIEIEKKYRVLNQQFRVKCECGHTTLLINKDKKICTHCGRYIFKNKKDEFIYRLNLTMSR